MRKLYNAKTKNAFLSAARQARNAGKTWREAFKAAKNAGYSGSEQGIKKMILYGTGKNSRRHAQRRRTLRRPGPAGHGLNAIQKMVDRMVKERVHQVLGRAIALLQQADKEI